MRETRTELGIGDAIRVGDRLLTVVDITDDEVTVRVDESDLWPLCGPAAGAEGIHESPRNWLEFLQPDDLPEIDDKGLWPPR